MENLEQEKIRQIIDSCRDVESNSAVNPWKAAEMVFKYASKVMQVREKAAFDEGQRSMVPDNGMGI
jgi:hypothetical protein